MGKSWECIYKYIKGATTPATSRWGVVFLGLWLSAISVSIGAWCDMNGVVVFGLVVGALAILLGIIWLIKGSKDITATKDDIKGLNKEIRELRKVIRKDIIAKGKRRRWHY